MRAFALLALASAAAGCGLGITGDSSGGADNLPASGAGPYARLPSDIDTPSDEPFVLEARDAVIADPDCRARGDGGYRCWFTYQPDDAPHAAIGYAEFPDLHSMPDVPPMIVFANGAVDERSPSLVDGPGGTTRLYHEVAGDVAVATSFDGGKTFTDDAATGLSPATSPSVAVVDGVYHAYFVRDGAIWHASSSDGASFMVDSAPAISPRPELDGAFDALGVGDPFVFVTTSDAGRHHFGLFFSGTARPKASAPDAGPEGEDTSIGYAGSFDGVTWTRTASPGPVLPSPAAGPCVVADGASSVLFFDQEQRLHLGVAAALP